MAHGPLPTMHGPLPYAVSVSRAVRLEVLTSSRQHAGIERIL